MTINPEGKKVYEMNSQKELQSKLGQNQVLVVNSTMEVRALVPWSKAMTMILDEKAYVVLDRPDGATIRSAYQTFNKPMVVSLVKYAKDMRRTFQLEDSVTKTHVLQRDRYTCQYCGAYGDTIDHIFPKSRGGKNTWGNFATACKKCNNFKRDRTPEEAGMPVPKIEPGHVTTQRLSEMQTLFNSSLVEIM